MKTLLVFVLAACGGGEGGDPNGGKNAPPTGSLTWACEHPACCHFNRLGCDDYGCCDPMPVVTVSAAAR